MNSVVKNLYYEYYYCRKYLKSPINLEYTKKTLSKTYDLYFYEFNSGILFNPNDVCIFLDKFGAKI